MSSVALSVASSEPAPPDATALAEDVVTGARSAIDLVEDHIERIERCADLNAVVWPLFEEARARAAALDRTPHPVGPLHGVPVTVKDQFDVAGAPTMVGLEHRRTHRATDDDPLVARLKAAGAIVVAKTAVPQLLSMHETTSPVHGDTYNPWDRTRTPGGSSGGEAALLAAGATPLGLGADFGGSIRVPCHFSGVCGLKPTSGRLPVGGLPELFAAQDAWLPAAGPMARTVRDLALAMRVMVQPAAGEWDAQVQPVPWQEPGTVSGLRIGVVEDIGAIGASPAIRRAVGEAAAALEARGAELVPVHLPFDEALSLMLTIFSADGAAAMRRAAGGDRLHASLRTISSMARRPRWIRGVLASTMRLLGQRHTATLLRVMGRSTVDDLWEAERRLQAMRKGAFDTLLGGRISAVIAPPFATPAPQIGNTAAMIHHAAPAVLFNLLELPAGVLPVTTVRSGEESSRTRSVDQAIRSAQQVEKGSAGLPVGVQVAAGRFREDVVLSVMGAIEAGCPRPMLPSEPR